jgi:transcriptional regulator with XRE-family HTH domain
MQTDDKNRLHVIRKKCRVLMAEMDMAYGKLPELSKELGVSRSQISMALTGYRVRPSSLLILEKLHNYLKETKRIMHAKTV